jgi:hypothetical protein
VHDPGFAAIGEPTVSLSYGSAPTFAGNPDYAWLASFTNGVVHNFFFKTDDDYVRAGSLECPIFCVEKSFEKTGRIVYRPGAPATRSRTARRRKNAPGHSSPV